MTDCLSDLFELVQRRYPYQPSSPTELETAERLEATREFQFPPELHHALFELTDSLEIQSCFESRHAFILGLDLGLSIARELRPFQREI